MHFLIGILHLDNHELSTSAGDGRNLRVPGRFRVCFRKFCEPLVEGSKTYAQDFRCSHAIVIGVAQGEPDIGFFHFLQQPSGLKGEGRPRLRLRR